LSLSIYPRRITAFVECRKYRL